jgi:hypothetical protein
MTPLVFVSAPSCLAADQRVLLERWTSSLVESGLTLEYLTRSEYEPNPWEQLRSILNGVDALLVCGFRQLHVSSGSWRPGTSEEEPVAARQWTSPWLQIETGMAAMLGLPVLVAPERGIAEGVFRPGAWNAAVSVYGSPLDDGPAAPEVVRWRAAVDSRFASRRIRPHVAS